nr:hypothetical protein [Myxococcus hansupus]
MGHSAEGGVVVEATPRASFEVVETNFSLYLLVVTLDALAQLCEAYELLQGSVRRQCRKVKFGGRFLVPGPFAQQPLLVAWGKSQMVAVGGTDA